MISIGCQTLLKKELVRFWKVGLQTVFAPILTTILYLLVFAQALNNQNAHVNYATFLIPGLIMMSVLQNAFANASSSLVQSKITGNLIFVLLPPLRATDIFVAYTLASVIRGFVVGFGVFLVTCFFAPTWPPYPLWAITFALSGATTLGILGLIGGLWADKFDQIAAFQNFAIFPLTFLAGVFYSTHTLSPFWQAVSHANPFFYMVDGFRYSFLGTSDVSPWRSLAVVAIFGMLLTLCTLRLLQSGYKLRR